jgi:hypothetical protein
LRCPPLDADAEPGELSPQAQDIVEAPGVDGLDPTREYGQQVRSVEKIVRAFLRRIPGLAREGTIW